MDNERQIAIMKLKKFLYAHGMSLLSVNDILKNYEKTLNTWLNEYLVTGTNTIPDIFADEIIESENIKFRLISN